MVGIRLRGGVKIVVDEDWVGVFLDFCYYSFCLFYMLLFSFFEMFGYVFDFVLGFFIL